MTKRRRRYLPNIWGRFKSYQHITNLMDEKVSDEDIQIFVINRRMDKVNKRRRSRIGLVEAVKPRVK